MLSRVIRPACGGHLSFTLESRALGLTGHCAQRFEGLIKERRVRAKGAHARVGCVDPSAPIGTLWGFGIPVVHRPAAGTSQLLSFGVSHAHQVRHDTRIAQAAKPEKQTLALKPAPKPPKKPAAKKPTQKRLSKKDAEVDPSKRQLKTSAVKADSVAPTNSAELFDDEDSDNGDDDGDDVKQYEAEQEAERRVMQQQEQARQEAEAKERLAEGVCATANTR